MLVQVRLKRKYIHSWATLIEKSVGHKYSPQKVVELVNRFKESLDKIAEVEYLSNQGIVYVGENDNIDVDSFENVYIMYTNEDLSKEETVLEDKTRLFFLKLSQTYSEDKNESPRFFIVDLSLRPELTEVDCHLKILKYTNGHIV